MNAKVKPRRKNPPRNARSKLAPISKLDKFFACREANKEKSVKRYAGFDNPKKKAINDLFAENIIEFLSSNATVVVLDTWMAVTSKRLMSEGIFPTHITAPNFNELDCEMLKEIGVESPQQSIETTVRTHRFDVGWHDSMTIMGGSIKHFSYVGLFTHWFLRRNHNNRCILAITITSESNQTDCNYLPQEEIFRRQIRAIIAWHNMVIVSEFHEAYKPNQIFKMWNLKPSRRTLEKPEFLTRDNNRLIGFQVGFTEAYLDQRPTR